MKAYPVPGKAKSAMLCAAFIAGAPRNAEGAVFYGVKAGNYADWCRVRTKGVPFYFIDGSYFDCVRGAQFRVTKNTLQHAGDGVTDGSRFAALSIAIKPWREWDERGHVLAVEQSNDHMTYTLRGDPWLSNMLKNYMDDGNLRWRYWAADKPRIQSTLADDLVGARLLITHTSAAAVSAILAGVAVDCAPECAAYDISYEGQRLQWAGVLADNQFTIPELKDGTAWRKLNP